MFPLCLGKDARQKLSGNVGTDQTLLVLAETGVIPNFFLQTQAQKPAVEEIVVDLLHQLTVAADMPASYAISVRRAGVLPAASFRFRVTPDTLAVRLTVPTIRVRRGLAPPSHKSATMADLMGLAPHAPCRAHQKKKPLFLRAF